MGLALYDSEFNAYGDSDEFRTFHDGQLGGAYEKVFYLRNDDPAKYYVSVTVKVQELIYEDWGEFGDTGWSIKLMYGERRPTEAEWDLVRSAQAIAIPDIGSSAAADTSTYHPIWVRVYCPGGESAQLRDNLRVHVTYLPRVVGA